MERYRGRRSKFIFSTVWSVKSLLAKSLLSLTPSRFNPSIGGFFGFLTLFEFRLYSLMNVQWGVFCVCVEDNPEGNCEKVCIFIFEL